MTRKLILEAWTSYRRNVIPLAAPPVQIEECRRAFYSGALSLFASIVNNLDAGSEATDKDIGRMQSIHDEIEAYGAEMRARSQRP